MQDNNFPTGKKIPTPTLTTFGASGIGCKKRWSLSNRLGAYHRVAIGLGPTVPPYDTVSSYVDNMIFVSWVKCNITKLSNTYVKMRADLGEMTFEEFYTGLYETNKINELPN